MKFKKHVRLGVLICCVPYLSFGQSAETFVHLPINEGKSSRADRSISILSLKEKHSGIYVLTQKNGCYFIDNNDETPILPLAMPNDRKDFFTDFVMEKDKLSLWANEHEIVSLDAEEQIRIPFSSTFFAETVEAQQIVVDAAGTIYVGTANDGIFSFSQDEWGSYTNLAKRISSADKELPSNNIQCLYRDANGVIWVGTDAGIATITNGIVKNLSGDEIVRQTFWHKMLGIRKEQSRFSESIHSIVRWGNSMILSSENNLFKVTVLEGSLQYVSRYDLSDHLSSPLEQVNEMMVDINGNLWIAANHLVYFNITADKLTVVSDEHNFRGQGFLSLTEDLAREKIWVGTNKGGLYKIDYPYHATGIGY